MKLSQYVPASNTLRKKTLAVFLSKYHLPSFPSMFVWLMPVNNFVGKFTIEIYSPGVFSDKSIRIAQITKDPYRSAIASLNLTLSAKSVRGQYGVH